jgi:hypothetical protein
LKKVKFTSSIVAYNTFASGRNMVCNMEGNWKQLEKVVIILLDRAVDTKDVRFRARVTVTT